MRNYNQRSVIAQQCIFQYILAHHIEVVGGLVKHQQIYRFEQELGQRQPGFFASRQYFYLFIDGFGAKKETAQYVPYLGPDFASGYIINGFENSPFGIEQLRLVLGVIADFYIMTQLAEAFMIEVADNDFGQRGFAFAIAAYERHKIAFFNRQLQFVEY